MALFPSWNSMAEEAVNSMATWDKLFQGASIQNRLRQEIASVEASWFAVENPQAVEGEAKRRLMEKLQRGE